MAQTGDMAEIEARIRRAHDAGDHGDAAALIVEYYGSGIMGYLHDRLRSPSVEEEVFSDFTENLLRGLPGFGWRSTARSWAYAIARNAAAEYFRAPDRRPGRRITLSHPGVGRMVERVRVTTAAHLRTSVKNRFRELRRELPEEDQVVLVLRLDREMAWEEIAVVLADGDMPAGDAVKQEAARLRQRFRRAKDRLKELAIEHGLLDSGH